MRATAVIAWREIVEHRNFMLAAVAVFLMSVVVPRLVAFGGWSSDEVRDVFTGVMAVGFTWICAGLLGAATVSATVAAGRFGFFMTRPVSGSAVWFGKILGVMVVLVVCEVIVVLPVALSARARVVLGDIAALPLLWAGLIVGIPLLLVLVGHTVATIWRAGSAWIAGDLMALAIASTVSWLSVSPLVRAVAEQAAFVIGLLSLAVFVLSVLAAGAAQITVGRCDRKRQHRAFASVLWPTLLLGFAGVAGYSTWLRSPALDDVEGAGWIVVQPDGEWIGLASQARQRFDVEASFIVNLDDGRALRLAMGSPFSPASVVTFSADGGMAAWAAGGGDQWSIRLARLDNVEMIVTASPVVLDERPTLHLSPSGRRMAVVQDGTLVVTEIDTGDLAGSVKLPPDRSVSSCSFKGEDTVRVLMAEPAEGQSGLYTVSAFEFDIVARKLVETGALPDVGEMVTATLDAVRDRLLIRTRIDREGMWRYVDARTLEPVEWSRTQVFAPLVEMLADGRLVRLVNKGDESTLERLTPDGEIDGRATLPSKPSHAVVGFEPSPSMVAIAVRDREGIHSGAEGWRLLLVDLDGGEVREIAQGVLPLRWWYAGGDVVTPLPAGSPATRLLMGDRGSLWLWDPASGETHMLVKGSRG